ncbi:Tenascin-X like protein [Argiope bruennichi]|uniref:Tenascin-X like protein n=1 Tax=Argiope bruennichi TaxID=94029 RepID=A0A8T0EP15_ARGBR|nr:Tenascin-X like protein [Argiope bruennichi]
MIPGLPVLKERYEIAKWCQDGCNTQVSTCEYKGGVGTCKCKDADKYYDYTKRDCTSIDKCFKAECGENQDCSGGTCKCKENYKMVNKTCERQDLCSLDKCFNDAKCEENSDSGLVKCSCKSDSKFYLSKRCQDGNCFLPGQRKGCKGKCPDGMTRNEEDGECKYKDDKTKCEKDCGFLGWCYKASEKAEATCVCDPTYAELNKTAQKCVLKATVCPSRQRDGDSKCKCTGKFKLAGNGITCDLRSCSDEDVQKECKTRGAEKCVDDWKNDGYKCVCPKGYIDNEKGCLDPCSVGDMQAQCSSKGQTCYIGAKDRTGDCRCPPSFTYDTGKQSCEISSADTFMIPGLPVLKKRYEIGENNINKVKLSQDVLLRMMQVYDKLEFAQLYNYKVEKDIIRCDVWLQFKPQPSDKFNATLEVKRWLSQLKEIKKNLLLPPNLFMSSDIVKAVEIEKLTLCTPTVLQDVCGRGSTCDEKKGCSCEAGYKEIQSTIKTSVGKRLVRCEDIDECLEGSHKCPANSKCINTLGDYFCKCNSGFKKAKGEADALDKEACVGLCDPNPCNKGSCQVTKEFAVECKCQVGYTGSFCKDEDVNLAKASKATKVVGAVLGTILAIVIILIIVYIVRQRKNSYSEDFTPAPRVDNAEMVERRPMRGVTNRAYQ